MEILRNIAKYALLIIILNMKMFSQEYLDERNMKLTEVSKDDTYGFSNDNPIKVGNKQNAPAAYLNALKTIDGDKMHIKDMKIDYNNVKGLRYIVLKYQNKPDTTVLYISTNELITPKAPKGFLFKTIADIPVVEKFPKDSIKKITPCKKNIYCPKNPFLIKKLGDAIEAPDKAPDFDGGLDSLKAYLVQHPLTDRRAKKISFEVTIYMVINCSGEAGNFTILNNPYGDAATLSNQMLGIFNSITQNWLPGLKDGKPVDCYHAVSMTVKNGVVTELW